LILAICARAFPAVTYNFTNIGIPRSGPAAGRVETMRASLREYSITFAAGVELAATSLERRATDASVRRNALLWRLRAIPQMRQACFRPEAVAALLDAWTFVRQMDFFLREGSGSNAFGALQPEALEVFGRLLAQMREIATSIAVSSEARTAFEHRIIDLWVVEHPLRDITFVRESPVARFAEQSAARGDAFQSVGTIEEVVSNLSQQARIYLAELPRQVHGEIDLLRSDLLPPERLDSVQSDLHVGAAASIAATAETVAELIRQERQLVLDEVSRQRALVLTAIADEREQVVGAIASAFAVEREQLLREFDAQRQATLEWAIRHVVDMVLLRVALGIIAAVVLAPLVAHVYARVWPRR
jgi:hypothetical protein